MSNHFTGLLEQITSAKRFGPGFEGEEQKRYRADSIAAAIFFPLCEYLDAEVWYCLPGALTLEDMDALLEYVGAPADVGCGKIRAAQGHPKPWLETLKRIRIEFDNEVWNGGNSYNGRDYWRDLIDRAKKSKWYRPNLVFVAAGNASGGLNLRLIKDVPNAFNIAIAPYIAHFYPKNIREVCPTPEDRARWMVGLGLAKNIYGQPMIDQIAAGKKAGMHFALYEMNHHLVSLEGDTNAKFADRSESTANLINEYVASQLAGVAVGNNMLAMMRDHGILDQTFFTFCGQFFNIRLWGGVVDIPHQRYRPTWLVVRTVNQAIMPTMVETTMSGNRPLFLMPPLLENNYGDMPVLKELGKGQYDSLWSYAFTEGVERSLVVANIDVDRSFPVKVKLNAPVAGGAKSWQVVGPGWNADNELDHGEPKVSLKEATIANFADGYSFTMPPASIITLRWRTTQSKENK